MRKEIIAQIIKERPDAVLVKNKYKVLAGMIKRMYPQHFEKIDYKIWEDIIYDAVNGDRDWRVETEGFDKKNKQRLEQQFIINNLL